MSKPKRVKEEAGGSRSKKRQEVRSVQRGKPPVSKRKVDAKLYKGVNLDEPAFRPLDEDLVL